MTEFLAYEVANLITGARYIGITNRRLRRRWKDHCSRANDSVLGRAIRKYGRDAFSIRVIAQAMNYGALLELEMALIVQERTRVEFGGYNVTDGGVGATGWVPPQSVRDKIAAASRKKMESPEARGRPKSEAFKEKARQRWAKWRAARCGA